MSNQAEKSGNRKFRFRLPKRFQNICASSSNGYDYVGYNTIQAAEFTPIQIPKLKSTQSMRKQSARVNLFKETNEIMHLSLPILTDLNIKDKSIHHFNNIEMNEVTHSYCLSCDSDFNSLKEDSDSFSLNSDSFFHSTPVSTKSISSEFSSTGSHSSGSSNYESDMYECCMAYEAHRVGDPIQLVYANSETAFVKNLSSGSYSYIPINCIQSLERF